MRGLLNRRTLVFLLTILTGTRSQHFASNSIDSKPVVSDYAPVLKVSSTEGYLAETAEIGTTVRVSPNMNSESLQILVNDDDLKPGMPPATYQYILTGLGATIFAVDQRGYVYLNIPNIDADPPNPSTYQLNVQAREVDTVPLRSSEPVTITIHVMDANDNSPQFEQPIYTANTTASGGERPIVMVVATDVDSGAYGEITYKISQVTNGGADAFFYDEATNMLFATGDLMPGERYQIVIDATDGGGRSSQAIVIVLATDPALPIASLPPLPGMETFNSIPTLATTPMSTSQEQEETIQQIVTEVSENTPPNTIVVTLGGQMNADINFSIVGGNEEGKFAVDPQTGTITTTDEFDREATAMYSLQVEARSIEPDQHLYWTVVQIAVLDVNDNAPQFLGEQPIRFSKNIDDLSELSPNMQIGRIEVEDADADDNGRLELRIAPPMNRLFTISPDGIFSVNGDFTAGHFGEHRVIIIARDHGEPPRETRAEAIVNIFGTLITVATVAPTNEISEYTTSAEEEPSTVPDDYLQSITPTPTGFSSFPNPSPIPQTPTTENTENTDYPQQGTSVETVTPQDYSYERTSEEIQTVATEVTEPPTTAYSPPTIPSRPPPPPPPPPPPSTTSTEEPEPEPAPRLAPVFNPSQFTVHAEENKAELEIAKVHASYIDGMPGPVSYVLSKGDPTLFAVSSFSGSVSLLRPLDAEANASYQIQVSTLQSSSMAIDPSYPHFATITIHVDDVNDWIPAFETQNGETFPIKENTMAGTIVGQVSAFDQDRDDPNNRIRYRLVSAGGLESHFSINPDNGIVTLARPVDAFAGEKITLRIEASDSGIPSQSSQVAVIVDVAPTSSLVIPEGATFSSRPADGLLQFSLRNYTTSVSEAFRPPHLVQVLSVNNKPSDTRFIICNIVSGNYRGAFGVVAGNDGNCELRTQMELDRESVERYLLNISVTSGSQIDYALVSVTVLDVNDNVPRFVYDNDLGLSIYFAGVSSTAGAFTRVLSVKAEDADLGNSSVVNYALDPLSVHSKYFAISPFGEISTKQSMTQVLQKNRLSFFEIRVSACDSPISGQQLCAKADVIINIVTEAHRFKMVTAGLTPQQLSAHEKDMVRSLRQFTGPCTLLNIEKMSEATSLDTKARTDVYWYAVNPSTKKICKKHEFRRLFETSSVQMVAGKVQPWFQLEKIAEEVGEDEQNTDNGLFSGNWKSASIVIIVLAAGMAVLIVIGIIAICFFHSKYKVSSRNIHPYSPHAYQPKLNTIYLHNPPFDPRIDKSYETQTAEMPISDEDLTMKSSSCEATQHRGMSYSSRNYGRPPSIGYEGDFSIEESMYAINAPGRIDPITKRIQTLVIPAPDYPIQNKSLL